MNEAAAVVDRQRNLHKGALISSRLGATDPSNNHNLNGDGSGCVCARVVCACVRACVRAVFEIYDNNIWPRRIMMKIKIIILCVIQIKHTDDFPSTGTRLVLVI